MIIQKNNAGTVAARYFRGLAIDEPWLGSNIGAATTNRVYLADALGSVVALTDSSGVISNEYDYEPFTVVTNIGLSLNSYKFTAREDDGTGMYYYRARFFHPALGRFVSEDPLEFVDGPNIYLYVGDHPLDAIDPQGLSFYQWLYTGDWNASEDAYREALDGAGDRVNCVITCLKRENKCALNWIATVTSVGIGYGATPRPIAEAIAGRSALGGSFLKSGVRAVGLRLSRWGLSGPARLVLQDAAAFKQAGAVGRTARIGVAGVAILETGLSVKCAVECWQ